MSFTLEITTIIHTPKSNVWRALTEPEQIKKYLFGTNTRTDWKVGSPITFSGVWEGKPYEDKGTVLEFEKEKTVKYSYWSPFSGKADVPENYYTITYSLKEENGQTEFTLIQDKIESKDSRDHSEKNWRMVFDEMKKMLEEGK